MRILRAAAGAGGFTLAEYIVLITVTGLIAAVLAVLIVPAVRTFSAVTALESLEGEAEATMERLTREIRSVTSHAHIINAEEDGFAFTGADGNDINYHSQGRDFKRNDDMFSGNLESVRFEYLDADGAPAGEHSGIRIIGIELVLSKGGQEVSLETRIRPRNF